MNVKDEEVNSHFEEKLNGGRLFKIKKLNKKRVAFKEDDKYIKTKNNREIITISDEEIGDGTIKGEKND